jgi:ATP-dependent Clp protease ATP-binding subunit ClpC
VFERFTERARQVVVLAQEEARILKHNYIGTEHILLGLLREEEGLAARVRLPKGARISPTKTFGGLNDRQRRELVQRLGR